LGRNNRWIKTEYIQEYKGNSKTLPSKLGNSEVQLRTKLESATIITVSFPG